MISVLLILPVLAGLRLIVAENSGLYISLQDQTSLCLSVGDAVGLVDCSKATQWNYIPAIGSSGPLFQYNQNLTVIPVNQTGYDITSPVGVNVTTASPNASPFPGYLWSWTANNAIQHYVDRDLCLQGDHTTGHVIPAKCSGKSDQAWSFRYTAGVLTDAVVPIGVVYSDPQGSHRIRGLGRDDLCVSSEAYPGSGNYDETLFPSLTASNYTGSLFAGLTATFAQCVSNDSPITSFQLFEPFSSGSGPIKFENSSAASNRSSYCIDAGDSPVNGSVVLVQTCKNGAVGQQWSTTNTSIALSGQNLCLQTGSEMYGGGRNEGDYTPIFVLQVFTCNNALKQQTFTTYAGENVAPPISTSRA